MKEFFMNENPGGTPNPLNPTPLDANPSEPMGETTQQPVLDEPVREEPVSTNPVQESASQPLTEELVEESVHVSSLDPEGRPMEKAAEVATPAPKKKKTSLIVGLVVCLFIAVGCGVAAVLMMMNSAKDPVSFAVEKLISGDVPTNLGVNGQIEISANDENSSLSKATIVLDSRLKTGSMINATNADVTLVTNDAEEYSFSVNEVYADSEDLYFKIEKKELELLEQNEQVLDETLLDETNCAGDESGMTNCVTETEAVTEEDEEIIYQDGTTGMLDGIVSMLGGQWLKLSLASSDWITGGLSMDGEMACVVDAAKSLSTNSNSLAEIYNKNPFIGSVADNIPINSNLNQLRQITIDSEKFTNFVNAIQNTAFTSAINECLDSYNEDTISADDILNNLGKLPAIYVEVNPDNTFSRFYTRALSDDGEYTITIDLSFTYPESINVSAPAEYTDLEELMKNLLDFDVDDDVIEDETEVEEEIPAEE